MRFLFYLSFVASMLITIQAGNPKEYIVDGQNPKASDQNVGTVDLPLKTIRKAGEIARITVNPMFINVDWGDYKFNQNSSV